VKEYIKITLFIFKNILNHIKDLYHLIIIMELLENNFIINLSTRPDRYEHVIQEFKKIDIKPNRFNAIQTKDGAIGCTMSHIKCLEIAIEKDYEQIFICEDDIAFLDPYTLKRSLELFEKKQKKWDVLIIGGNVVKPYENIDNYCLKIKNCQTTTGYIVKKQYYKKLLENFREGVNKLLTTDNKRQFAIDIYWKNLQFVDNWYLLYPLTVTQYENFSDIEKKNTNYNHLMLDPHKEWLYKRRLSMDL
jgi:GR25 family glycosyltransferase involved in LPS biosynthesis